ncbi:hypothetical protein D3C78_1354890 [compost metagenome]
MLRNDACGRKEAALDASFIQYRKYVGKVVNIGVVERQQRSVSRQFYAVVYGVEALLYRHEFVVLRHIIKLIFELAAQQSLNAGKSCKGKLSHIVVHNYRYLIHLAHLTIRFGRS